MRPIWFGPKAVGYGMGPTSWQGWLATLTVIAAVAGLRFFFHPQALGLPAWSKPAATAGIVIPYLLLAFLTYGNDDEA